MTDKRAKGKRNLLILNWMGLACQAVGIISTFAGNTGLVDASPVGSFSMLVFGMALSGWAGNLQEITDLKYRVLELEGHTSNSPASES